MFSSVTRLITISLLLITVVFGTTVPAVVLANDNPSGGTEVVVNIEGHNPSISLENPLKADNLQELLSAILNVMLVFPLPIVVFFIIYAGFQYVVAQGNEEKLKKAHKILLWSIVGGLIILGANLIFAVIKGTIDSFQ